jgi:hypothetical protein
MKQTKAASHMREILAERGFDIPSRRMTLGDNQQWVLFERGNHQVGIDSATGIWLRESGGEWRCVGTVYSTSGAFMAVDFLTGDKSQLK